MTGAPEPLDPLASADSWDRLVSTALVGTAKRPVPQTPDLPPTPEAEDAVALLDRAALITVRRAAGYTPATGITPVTPDTGDERPEAGRAADHRLDRILAGRTNLLPEWLELVAASGRRVAPFSVPELLDWGARESHLRPLLARAIGSRGRWMARFNPTWSYMRAHPAPTDRFNQRDWESSDPDERRRALAVLRAADPDRARELLTTAWPGLAKAELRRRLLETLATGLGPADGEFLERALGDRGANVRGAALSLLTRLPDSAHADRLRGYVRAGAAVDGQGRLRVHVDGGDDAGVHRDLALAAPGEGSKDAQHGHERVWALVTHAPLDAWPARLGLDPAGVLAAARKGSGKDARLFDAFVNAVAVQGSAEWARAVLDVLGSRIARGSSTSESFQLAKLLELLPVEERCARVSGVLDESAPLVRWGDLLAATRGPWTPELSARVTARLRTRSRRHDHHGYRVLCEAAATNLPPAHLDELPEKPPHDDASGDQYLRLRDTLRFRHDMHREL